jgi:hypothetical protein
MSVSLELLTQILAKVGISSSHEEEILTVAIKDSNTPPETNEDSTSENSYASDDFEEDNEEELQQDLSEEKHTYESLSTMVPGKHSRLD